MTGRFPFLCAVGRPNSVARLSTCCRAFRTIFSDDEVWSTFCAKALGALKPKATSWKRFYGDRAHTACPIFSAYADLLRETVQDPSFGLRVEFEGRDLPEAWRGADCLRMEVNDTDISDFGLHTGAYLHWSDLTGFESLPEWDLHSRRISILRVVADFNGEKHTVLEVDAGKGCALDVERPCDGIEVDDICRPEVPDSDEPTAEDLCIRVWLPTARILQSILGTEEMKAAAAWWMGKDARAGLQAGSEAGLMLFGEVRQDNSEHTVVSLASAWPEPVWHGARHVFYFRQAFGAQLQAWRRDKALPFPGYKFTFALAKPTTDADELERCWYYNCSLWCLDACGNTFFVCYDVNCRPGKKFKCGMQTAASPKITHASLRNFLVCDLQPKDRREGAEAEFTSINVFMMPCLVPFEETSAFGGRSLLDIAYDGYMRRILDRFLLRERNAETARYSSWDQAEATKHVLSFQDADLLSEDSDPDGETGSWRDPLAMVE